VSDAPSIIKKLMKHSETECQKMSNLCKIKVVIENSYRNYRNLEGRVGHCGRFV
jgi:hypothetical protein